MSQDKDIIIRQTSWSPFLNRICIITYCNKVRIQLKIADAMTSLTTCSVTKSVVLESHYCWNYKIHPNIRITKTAVMHPIFSVWKHVDSTNPANTVHILIQQATVKASYFISVEATLIKTTATSWNLTDCHQLYATFTNTKDFSQHPKDNAQRFFVWHKMSHFSEKFMLLL